MKRLIPNYLTYSRMVVIPLIVAGFYLEAPLSYWLTSTLFMYASATDFLDGYLAREWDVQSNIGRFLDPIADKLLVSAAMVMLVAFGRADVIAVVIILMREILVSGLREYLMESKVPMPVSRLAKYKTGFQMTAIYLLLLGDAAPLGINALFFGDLLLWVAVILTVITGYDYLRRGIVHILR